MTRARLNTMLNLIEKVNDFWWPTVQASITIEREVTIHVYDNRPRKSGKPEESLSFYYMTEDSNYLMGKNRMGKNPKNKSIIYIFDADLILAERYLKSIIKSYEDRKDDHEL